MSRSYDGPERRSPEGWHVRKELHLGHLLTTMAMVGAGFVWAKGVDTRLALLETHRDEQLATDARQDAAAREAWARLESRLSVVDAKLDRLIGWQINRGTASQP